MAGVLWCLCIGEKPLGAACWHRSFGTVKLHEMISRNNSELTFFMLTESV